MKQDGSQSCLKPTVLFPCPVCVCEVGGGGGGGGVAKGGGGLVEMQ